MIEQIENCKNIRLKIEERYVDSKEALFAMYDDLYLILGGNGENNVCYQMREKRLCDCCGFPKRTVSIKGKPTNSFAGMMPFEVEYLSKKEASISFEEKLEIHPWGIGFTCKKVESKCVMKPFDCALYPYAFSNFADEDGVFSIDILYSYAKCPIFTFDDVMQLFFDITFERTITLAKRTIKFDSEILKLICAYAPFYRGFKIYRRVTLN